MIACMPIITHIRTITQCNHIITDCSTGCSHCQDGSPNSCFDCLRGYYYSPINEDSGRCFGKILAPSCLLN